MTTPLAKLKLLLGTDGYAQIPGSTDTDKDAVLSQYLTIAGEEICARAYPYSYVTTVPDRYKTLQVRIAEFLVQKRGAEGQTGHSEGGISRSYEGADIPKFMLSQIIPFVSVPTMPVEEDDDEGGEDA